MKKFLLLLIIGLTISSVEGYAQFTKYIVRLKDKGTNPYTIANPSQYLTARSIQRRVRYSIPIDSTDLPITPRYIDSIRLAGAVTILNVSKWLNQVCIQTSDAAALTKINGFPFVLGTSPVAPFAGGGPQDHLVNKQLDVATNQIISSPTSPQTTSDYYSYGQSFGQVHITQGEFLHNHGFRGQGMQMAVLDAGFFHYLTLPTFDSLRNNGQVLGTWDFVAGNASVDEDNSHGMNCLSTITANMPGVFMGQAPKVSVYLYRTEDVASEYPIEEQNWCAGIERADSLGIDVSSTSLGYNQFDNAIFNYVYADLDGNTTMIAKAADFAAKKGILVLAAAGNEGTNAWHYIITPADADSTIAVGAVNTAGVVGSFSSYGPSADGQVKPSISNVGVNAVIANPSNGQPSFGNGTSFACPNMAGISTCLWQAFPEVNNMTIINTMQQSATRASNPDNRVGYGIPDMKKAFVMLIKQLYTQSATTSACNTILQWTVKTDTTINVFVERKLPAASNYTVINQQGLSGAFLSRPYTYIDDLTGVPTGIVWYRFKMQIGASDTTFFLDSVPVNHNVNCSPTAVLTTSVLNPFPSVCVGSTGGPGGFSISGANLPAGNVTVGPLTGFAFSTTLAGPFTASLSIPQAGGSFSQTVYVNFSPTAAQSYNGNIPVSIGATSTNVAVTAAGINTIATMTTGTASAITISSATLAGTIASIGCSNVTAYGIEYSTVNGFANGTGTSVAATSNVAGVYNVTLNGLAPGTTYYYKAYGTNAGGTAYGSQLSFTTLPIPNDLVIYSTPVDTRVLFHYSINNTAPGHYATLIYNSAGQLVFKKEMDVTTTFINDYFYLPTLSGGVYTLQLQNKIDGFKKTKQFSVK